MNGKQSVEKFMKHWAKKRELALNFRMQYDNTFIELDSFLRGEQWTNTAQRQSWLSTPVNNTLHLVQQAKIAVVSETELITRIKPLSQADISKTENLESIMSSYWDHSRVKEAITEVKSDSRKFPIGYLQVQFDGSVIVGTENNLEKGGFKLTSVDPARVYWDPKAEKEEELSFIYRTHSVTWKDIKNTAKYNKDVIADMDKYHQSQLDLSNKEDSGEILDRNYDMQGEKSTLYEIYYRWKPASGSDFKYGVIHTVSKGTTDGKDGAEEEMTPLWFKADLGIKRHPLIPLREFKQPHEFLGRSSVQLVLDKQKQINKVDAIIANIANQLQNNQKLIAADSGIDPKILAKYASAPGLIVITKTDINNSMKWIDPPEISATLLQHKKESKDDIYEVANITPTSVGQNAGSLNSSSGVSSLISQAQAMETVPRQAYKKFLENVYRTMMELLIKNGASVTRRIDNHDPELDEDYRFVDFDFSAYKNFAADVSIDIKLTQQEIAQQKQEVVQIMQIQAQTGQQLLTPAMIIELMNFPDKDRILASYHGQQQQEQQQKEMAVATQAALIMQQEITNPQGGSENVDVSQMAQIAATEAIQQIEEKQKQGGQQSQQGQQPQQTSQGAAGSAAPQPGAQAAVLGQQ